MNSCTLCCGEFSSARLRSPRSVHGLVRSRSTFLGSAKIETAITNTVVTHVASGKLPTNEADVEANPTATSTVTTVKASKFAFVAFTVDSLAFTRARNSFIESRALESVSDTIGPRPIGPHRWASRCIVSCCSTFEVKSKRLAAKVQRGRHRTTTCKTTTASMASSGVTQAKLVSLVPRATLEFSRRRSTRA